MSSPARADGPPRRRAANAPASRGRKRRTHGSAPSVRVRREALTCGRSNRRHGRRGRRRCGCRRRCARSCRRCRSTPPARRSTPEGRPRRSMDPGTGARGADVGTLGPGPGHHAAAARRDAGHAGRSNEDHVPVASASCEMAPPPLVPKRGGAERTASREADPLGFIEARRSTAFPFRRGGMSRTTSLHPSGVASRSPSRGRRKLG